jgi:nucleoside-diphosphate-sugar epimerase
LIPKLLESGYEVHALVRSQEGVSRMQALGALPAWGDITARESMRAAMRGSDVVFHVAGWYKLGFRDQSKAETINVEGTRNVLGLAHELGVPKIVYTSSIAVIGDTHGYLADETDIGPEWPFLNEYDRTKWLAHCRVALPLIERGAPIVIVTPGVVYGPEDPSLVGELMRYYYKGYFPILPGPEFAMSYAHVEDVAEGHILAAEKGRDGESYLLTGPARTLSELSVLWSQLSGRRLPLMHLPARFLRPLAPLADVLNALFSLPSVVSRDAVTILGATYIARSDKARAELGWQPRPLEQGMRETLEWIAQDTARGRPRVRYAPPAVRRRQIASVALGAAIGLLFAWLLTRRHR